MKPVITMVNGRYMNLIKPFKSDVDVNVIAHALSNLCRFTGHVRQFYSVAQHSVSVSYLVPPEHALQGLLHDAAEAYIGDVSSPLKTLLPDYREIEHRVEQAVWGAFSLPERLHSSVKYADLVMLATEKRDLMPVSPEGDDTWSILDEVEALPSPILPMVPEIARAHFLARFRELSGMAI